jgi:hypothetical protein
MSGERSLGALSTYRKRDAQASRAGRSVLRG